VVLVLKAAPTASEGAGGEAETPARTEACAEAA
jgi:hypothetical protein